MSVLQENNKIALIIWIFLHYIGFIFYFSFSNLKYCQSIVFRNMKLLPAYIVKTFYVYMSMFFFKGEI